MNRRLRRMVVPAALVLASLGASRGQSPKPATPSDDEIQRILTERVNTMPT